MLIKNKKWKNYILGTLSFFVLILLFEIYPRVSNILSLGYDLYERYAKTKEAEQNNLNENNFISENKKLKLQINSFVSNYEESQKISSIISFLDDIASKNDIEIAAIIPGKVEKKNNLWLQPIEININSNYEGMFNFVRSLEKSPKVILLKGLDFKPIKPKNDSLNVKAPGDFLAQEPVHALSDDLRRRHTRPACCLAHPDALRLGQLDLGPDHRRRPPGVIRLQCNH